MRAPYLQALPSLVANYTTFYTSPYSIGLCSDCGDEVALVWKENTVASFQHSSNTTCDSTRAVEEEILLYAKSCLANYLCKGNTIILNSSCEQCAKVSLLICDDIQRVEANYFQYINGVKVTMDLALFDIREHLVFGIMFSPSFVPSLHASSLTWAEVDPAEVITKLGTAKHAKVETLSNRRLIKSCKDVACFPLHEIASQLGYLVVTPAYACSARRLLDVALTGSFSPDREFWYAVPADQPDIKDKRVRQLWNSLLRRQRCLRCGGKHQVGYQNPYCLTCFMRTGCDSPASKRITVEAETKNQLVNLFSWLDDVPILHKGEEACAFCNDSYLLTEEEESGCREPDTNRINNTVWWRETKRRCCSLCLEARITPPKTGSGYDFYEEA